MAQTFKVYSAFKKKTRLYLIFFLCVFILAISVIVFVYWVKIFNYWLWETK